jgi:hypothetical protein
LTYDGDEKDLSKSDAAFIGVDKKEEDDKGEVEMVE